MNLSSDRPVIRIMSDRRSLFGMLIGLTLCVSIWQISTQDAHLITGSNPYDSRLSSSFADGHNAIAAAPNAAIVANTQQLPSFPSKPASAASIALDQLAIDDASRLIDLTNFKFLINQSACSSSSSARSNNTATPTPLIIVIVHSAPGNWAKRNVIRETWGSDDNNDDIGQQRRRRRQRRDHPDEPADAAATMSTIRVLFMLGAVSSPQAQHKIEQENYLYGDIVQGNFIDAYRNMTYKHAMSLKWFTYFCPDADYLLKTDDDVFVHTPNAKDFLHDPGTQRSQLLLCFRTTHVRISRSYRSKWRVSPHEYPGRYYPQYCPGYSIVYSADVVFRLYREAQRTPYFWIDDVHVTGTLATAGNVTITPFGTLYISWSQHDRVLMGVADAEDVAAFAYFVFTAPNLPADRIRRLWQRVKSGSVAIEEVAEAAVPSSSSSASTNVLNAQHTSATSGS